jgi:hypothetical protein
MLDRLRRMEPFGPAPRKLPPRKPPWKWVAAVVIVPTMIKTALGMISHEQGSLVLLLLVVGGGAFLMVFLMHGNEPCPVASDNIRKFVSFRRTYIYRRCDFKQTYALKRCRV